MSEFESGSESGSDSEFGAGDEFGTGTNGEDTTGYKAAGLTGDSVIPADADFVVGSVIESSPPAISFANLARSRQPIATKETSTKWIFVADAEDIVK